jgi:hypothetical protein
MPRAKKKRERPAGRQHDPVVLAGQISFFFNCIAKIDERTCKENLEIIQIETVTNTYTICLAKINIDHIMVFFLSPI